MVLTVCNYRNKPIVSYRVCVCVCNKTASWKGFQHCNVSVHVRQNFGALREKLGIRGSTSSVQL